MGNFISGASTDSMGGDPKGCLTAFEAAVLGAALATYQKGKVSLQGQEGDLGAGPEPLSLPLMVEEA